MEPAEKKRTFSGLLVGPIINDPRNIKVVIVGDGGTVGKTIEINVLKSSFNPLNPNDEAINALLIEAYASLLPTQSGGWTAVMVNVKSIDTNKVHTAEVQVLQNPLWNPDLFSLRPPDPETVSLLDLLGMMVVRSKPATLSKFTNSIPVSLDLITQILHRFEALFHKISYEVFWHSFEMWNAKLEKKKHKHSLLLSALAFSVERVPKLDEIRDRLRAVVGSDRIRASDVMFAPLLRDENAFKIFKRLASEQDLRADLGDWLFRRTFNRTLVLITKGLINEFNYPKNPLVQTQVAGVGNEMLVLLKFSHTEAQFRHLREFWRLYQAGSDRDPRAGASGRRALLQWIHMEMYAEGGIDFPFLQQGLDMFNQKRDGVIQLAWKAPTKSFTRLGGFVSGENA